MYRIPAIAHADAQGTVKDMLDSAKKAMGMVPNLLRVAAQSPAALQGMLGLMGAVEHGTLGRKLGEQIALAVAERNGCDYCLSAHTAIGRHAGLSAADLAQARDGHAAGPKAEAAMRFAIGVVEQRGHVSDADLAAARAAGLSNGEIVEVIAHVAVNTFTNLLNNVAQTEIDFPAVRAAVRLAA